MFKVKNIFIASNFERQVLVQDAYLFRLIGMPFVLEFHVLLTEGGDIFK